MSDIQDGLVAAANGAGKTLPYDIWYMILENIWEDWEQDQMRWEGLWPWEDRFQSLVPWFMSIRTISKDFHRIGTKFAFQAVRISERSLTGQASTQYHDNFKANVISNSLKIYIEPSNSADYQQEILDIVSKSEKLIIVLLDTTGDDEAFISRIMSASIQTLSRRPSRHDLIIHHHPCRASPHNDYMTIASHGVKGEANTKPLIPVSSSDSSQLQHIAQSPAHGANKLGIYSCAHEYFPYRLLHRLPAIAELSLCKYDWTHTLLSYQQVWDFSNLTNLNLIEVSLDRFFTTVEVEDLLRLQSLHLSGHFHDVGQARESLRTLLPRLQRLKDLRVVFELWQNLLPPSLVAEVGRRLEVLQLKELQGTTLSGPLAAEDLLEIQRHCPRLKKLTLDWTDNLDDQTSFMDVLCSFENVEILNLYSEHGFPMDGIDPLSTDPDFDGSQKVLDHLCTSKAGKPFNELWIHSAISHRPLENPDEPSINLGRRSFGRVREDGVLKQAPKHLLRFEKFPTAEELIALRGEVARDPNEPGGINEDDENAGGEAEVEVGFQGVDEVSAEEEQEQEVEPDEYAEESNPDSLYDAEQYFQHSDEDELSSESP